MLAITPQADLITTSFRAAPSQTAHYSVHTDHQGSVRAVPDLTGQIVNSHAYDAYGNAEAAVESLPQRFRYTGREWDGVTRLYHYRARAYDPETGRFLQEDPLWFNAGDLNVYRYVGNNPVNATDPSGMAVGFEQRALYAIGLGMPSVITLNQIYTLKLHLKLYDAVSNSTLFQAVKVRVSIANQGLGCLIGLQLSAIGVTISESSSANVTDDGCAVVGSEADGGAPGSRPHSPGVGDIGTGEGIDKGNADTWPSPPGPGPHIVGRPSRKKPQDRKEESIYDGDGREWRPHVPDVHHPVGHWDTKGPQPNDPWENY
jgi:RHS repeat-associated protein